MSGRAQVFVLLHIQANPKLVPKLQVAAACFDLDVPV